MSGKFLIKVALKKGFFSSNLIGKPCAEMISAFFAISNYKKFSPSALVLG